MTFATVSATRTIYMPAGSVTTVVPAATGAVCTAVPVTLYTVRAASTGETTSTPEGTARTTKSLRTAASMPEVAVRTGMWSETAEEKSLL